MAFDLGQNVPLPPLLPQGGIYSPLIRLLFIDAVEDN
jgi:hypothetical protein